MNPVIMIGLEDVRINIHGLQDFDLELYDKYGAGYYRTWAGKVFGEDIRVIRINGKDVVGFMLVSYDTVTYPAQFIFKISENRDVFRTIFHNEPHLYITVL